MRFSKTERGFAIVEFEDMYEIPCSVQESSLASDQAIWLGVSDPKPKKLVPNKGWAPVALDGVMLSTRMHLNREQVEDLIKILQAFVNTGHLPSGEIPLNKGSA